MPFLIFWVNITIIKRKPILFIDYLPAFHQWSCQNRAKGVV